MLCKIIFDNIIGKYHVKLMEHSEPMLMVWTTFASAYRYAILQHYQVSIPDMLDYVDTNKYQLDYQIYMELTQ